MVHSGDTLSEISRNSRLSVKEIMAYNNLKSSRILSGQVILLPGVTSLKKGNKMQKLNIVHRNIWGAMTAGTMNTAKSYNKITVHHTTEKKSSHKRNDVHFLQTIQKYHIDEKKWADIGYHFIIGKDGKIYEGRLLKFYGAHVKNHNIGNIGIALLGDFHSNPLNTKQRQSLNLLINALREKYNIHEKELYAHRELGNTSCPGDHTMDFLETFRN